MLEKLAEPRPAVINSYGPTECSDVVAWYTADSDLETYRHQSIPIGRPIRNMQLHVLDSYGQLLPVGVPGEIHIGGIGVARGYLNLPQLSSERFIADPFYGKTDARLYKTGDIGRWLPDGTLQYLGRNDDQVKIRGLRVELGKSSRPRRTGRCTRSRNRRPRARVRPASGGLPVWRTGRRRTLARRTAQAPARAHGAQRLRRAGRLAAHTQWQARPPCPARTGPGRLRQPRL